MKSILVIEPLEKKQKLKIALGSDWHWGEEATSTKKIKAVCADIASHNPDVLVLAGDFNGGVSGHSAVNFTLDIVRKYLNDVNILSCLGNHDYWIRGNKVRRHDPHPSSGIEYNRPTMSKWTKNYEKIVESFRKFGVHFLDEDGVWRMDSKFPGYAIVGHTGWYNYHNPPTNDFRYMPNSIEASHPEMNKKAYKKLEEHLSKLEDRDIKRIFVSHFPVVELKTENLSFGGNPRVGELLRNEFNCEIFLNGHFHERHNGPLRFECGSDYGHPKYLIINI